ncbi:hypothetical protein PybrP1_008012 [[Pythium] brassicae (nom. inval.)]|nr:hypothetical protein PybrP1_008012 [[Pythium] brassicae (nom. inval.)]
MLARSAASASLARSAAARSFFKSANTAAQVAVDEEFPGVPAPSPRARAAPKIEVSVTPAGVKIASSNAEPLVTTLGVQLATGVRDETDETAGISQLFAKMAFRATDARSDLRLFRDIEAIGGVVNKAAGRDFVRYSISVLPDHAEAAAQILAETTLAPRFAQWDIDAQKVQVRTELELLAGSPSSLVAEGVHAAAFYDDVSLGRPLVSVENLAKFGAEDLWKFYETYVNSANAAVFGSGIEHSDLANLVGSYFSDLPAGSAAPHAAAKYVGGESRVKTAAPVTHVALGFETVGKRDALYGSAHVLRAVLAGRLNAKFASAFYTPYIDGGLVGFSGHAANADVGALVDSFAAEIKSLATTSVSAEELAVAKTVASLNILSTIGSRNGATALVGLLGVVQAPAPAPLSLAESATAKSVQELAKRALASRPSVASVGKVSAVPHVDALIAKLQ